MGAFVIALPIRDSALNQLLLRRSLRPDRLSVNRNPSQVDAHAMRCGIFRPIAISFCGYASPGACMCLSDFLRSQFGSPSGLFGSLFVAPFLNLTNIGLIRASVELLEPEPDDRVLDVGFGGGYSLLALADRMPNGRVVGVDHSPDMVVAAANLIQAKKLQARIRVRRGNVVNLPFAANTFDRVLTVNTIYYWQNLRAALGEIARVLKPGGRLAVAFRSPESLRLVTLAWDNFRRYEPQEVAEAMRKTGFRVPRVVHTNLWRIPDDLALIGESKKRSPRQADHQVAAVAGQQLR